jgi:amidase
LRIAWWDDFGGLPLCQRTRSALARTVERLRQQGMTVERRSPARFNFEQAWQAYGVIAGTEIGLGMPAVQRQMFSILGHLVPASEPVTRAFLRGFSFSSRRYNEALNLREHLIEQLEAFLDDWDAWLCPVASTVAYPHCRLGGFRKPPKLKVDERLLPYMEAAIGWTTPFSLTGNPVAVLPAGIEDGLPVGLQWIGKRWRDESLLAICAQVEAVAASYSWPVCA